MPSERGLHDHCRACFNAKCNVRQPSCDVIHCELDCGARFHACKKAEHTLLCGNEKVACLNVGYGCPIKVQRSQMSRHLGRCPASLVHCTMEWNRWPVCSSERQSHQPVQVVMDFNQEQLDMALALRDQRMLTKSMRASVRTRQILTNNLNRRHPAVPLSNQLTNGSAEKDFDDQRELENLLQDMHQWENETEKKRSRSPAGLRQSICDELYRASRDTAQQLSNALQVMKPDDAAVPDKPDFSLGSTLYPYIHCAHCERRKERLDRLIDSHNAMKDALDSQNNHQSHCATDDDDSVPHTHHNGDAGHHHDDDDVARHLKVIKASSLENLAKEELNYAMGMTKETRDAHVRGGDDDIKGQRSSSSSSDGSLCDVPMPVLFVTPSTTGEVSAAPGRGHSKILVVEPPQMIPGSGVASFPAKSSDSPLQASLSLDLSLESITRYQAKPDSMYTFLCAQVFRRDEFASHFQNVHCDIHGGLNGWLEQRCPLAPYGCTYSQRRFYPGQKSARIIHNEHLESFGVRLDGSRTPVRPEDGTRAGVPVEMEWVHVGVSPKENTASTDRKETDPTEIIKSSPAGFSTNNRSVDESHHELDKEMTSDDVINRNQTDQSGVSLHAIHQSGNSINRHQGEAQLDRTVIDNSPAVTVSTNDAVQSATASHNTAGQSDSAISNLDQSEPDYLSSLPSELLRYLTRFLDAFSLCNLALTSKLLRQICCSILEERGMVIQYWERKRGGWDVAYKVWHFSTAFTPVRTWGFEDHPSLAVHLSKCPYNVRLHQTDPVRVMIKLPESSKQGQAGEKKTAVSE